MKLRFGLMLFLAACGKTEAPAVPAGAPTAPPSAAVETPEVPALNPDYVVDEPLPPFDEGGGRPSLVAQSAVSSGGQMSLYEAPDGTRLLRFEDLSVAAAPDLEVVLSKSAAPSAEDFAAAISLGALKGARGNQNYLVSSKLALKPLQTVAVISRSQNVVLATAPLIPPK